MPLDLPANGRPRQNSPNDRHYGPQFSRTGAFGNTATDAAEDPLKQDQTDADGGAAIASPERNAPTTAPGSAAKRRVTITFNEAPNPE